MKKIIIASALVVSVISLTAFTHDKEKVNDQVLHSFNTQFKEATQVRWQTDGRIIKAGFLLNNTRFEAYYNNEGELLGTAKNILADQLPAPVIKKINKKFTSAAIYEITEYNCEEESFYTMVIETAFKKIKVKAFPSGETSLLKKLKK